MTGSEISSRAAIGFGSNLGERGTTIERALAGLAATGGVEIEAVSAIIETDPVGPAGQGPYLNGAVIVRTTLEPRALLDRCLEIERSLGRVREQGTRWGPRTIDLDLLLYDQRIIDEPGLRIPHPALAKRRFVLEPLAQIAPQWVHPELGRSVEWLSTALADSLKRQGAKVRKDAR